MKRPFDIARFALALLIFSVSPAWSQTQQANEWVAWARAHAEQVSDEGLAHLANAVDLLDREKAFDHSLTLSDIGRDGWLDTHSEIADLIRGQAPALEEAVAAAEGEQISFPGDGFRAQILDYQLIQMVVRILSVEARRLEAIGEPGPAARRAVQTMRLGEHLRADNVHLVQNLVGIAAEHMGMGALESILRHSDLQPVTLRAIQRELTRLEGVREPTSAMFRSAMHGLPDRLLGAADGVIGRDETWFREEEIERAQTDMGSFEVFEAECHRVAEDLLANVDRPRWEREPMDADWISRRTDHPLADLMVPNLTEALARSDFVFARLRLCQTLTSLRLGETPDAIDPFDGALIRVSDVLVWSVGPDGRDNLGLILYDPTNGTASVGDIAARR